MPIQKRKLPRRVKVRKPKIHPRVLKHRRECDELYNRLQRDDDDSIRSVMDRISGVPVSAHVWVGMVMAKFDCEVKTLQINGGYANGASYRCTMHYTDRSVKPQYGHIHPRLTVVKTSTTVLHSVILAYIEICKRHGKFI